MVKLRTIARVKVRILNFTIPCLQKVLILLTRICDSPQEKGVLGIIHVLEKNGVKV